MGASLSVYEDQPAGEASPNAAAGEASPDDAAAENPDVQPWATLKPVEEDRASKGEGGPAAHRKAAVRPVRRGVAFDARAQHVHQ